MSERVSILEVPFKHFDSFNRVSREQYGSSDFKNLAETSAIDAFSMCSFYVSQHSKNATAAVGLSGKKLASTEMDGEEATKRVALNLSPVMTTDSGVFERKVWNDDLIVNVVKQGFLRKIIGRTKLVDTIRIPMSQLAVRD